MQSAYDHSDILRFLRSRDAHLLEHPGGTLLDHLLRTADRLESWGAEPTLVSAGLCHAAYGTQGFPTALIGVQQRAELVALVGEAAESIVYAYGSCDRSQGLPEQHGQRYLHDRLNGARLVPSETLRRQLAELTCANELDVTEHARLSDSERAAIAELLLTCQARLSPAATSQLSARLDSLGCAQTTQLTASDIDLASDERGDAGPRLMLVHGGAGPELTWARQAPLFESFRVSIPWRRGFAPSARTTLQDWQVDARDLLRLMPDGAHVVAHSFGGLAASIAASWAPQRFASLTLIEVPLFSAADDDPVVQEIVSLSRAFMAGDDPVARARFLAAAALPLGHPETERLLARGLPVRDPGEALPAYETIRARQLPVWVVSGGHSAGLERLSDVLATKLNAQRWCASGQGHAVQRHPDFNRRLAEFVHAAQARGSHASAAKTH
jgi:pimeloyl-ACP methyl ester carboxylesterase